jgi:hypothetical protein
MMKWLERLYAIFKPLFNLIITNKTMERKFKDQLFLSVTHYKQNHVPLTSQVFPTLLLKDVYHPSKGH